MCPIGDSFPESVRATLVDENFTIGAVLRFYCLSAKKIKRFIYLGDKHDKSTIALLYINTNLNTNVNYTPELQAEHLFLEQEGRVYLDNDSFVDCSQFVVRLKDEIRKMCIDNTSIHLGFLSEEDLKRIRNMVKQSKVLTPRKKKDYGCFL
jgi:hypothetical protein